jgi:hypothetical protein
MKNSAFCFKQSNRFYARGKEREACFWMSKAVAAKKIELRQMHRNCAKARYNKCFKKAIRSLEAMYISNPIGQNRAA